MNWISDKALDMAITACFVSNFGLVVAGGLVLLLRGN
jgi:hypothetical protein